MDRNIEDSKIQNRRKKISSSSDFEISSRSPRKGPRSRVCEEQKASLLMDIIKARDFRSRGIVAVEISEVSWIPASLQRAASCNI